MPPPNGKANKGTVGPLGYALISLVGLLFALVVLFFIVRKAEVLSAYELTGRAFYVLLIPLGLGAASFLFGALRSFAKFTGRQGNHVLDLGGPIIGAALVVIGGFWLVPNETTFSVVVRIHGPSGYRDNIGVGQVVIDLGKDRRSAPISANGEAHFDEIPMQFRGAWVPIIVDTLGYQAADSTKRYHLDRDVIYIQLQRDSPGSTSLVLEPGSRSVGFKEHKGSNAPIGDAVPTAISLIIDNIGADRVDFSIVNPWKDRNIQVTSIAAERLTGVDLCSMCSASRRIPLQLNLRDRESSKTLAHGSVDNEHERLYGSLETFHLGPGEAAPFSLSTKLDLEGAVVRLAIDSNVIEEAAKHVSVPPYLFYLAKPNMESNSPIKVFTLEDWTKETDATVRRYVAQALGTAADERAEQSLLNTLNGDSNAEVRAAAARSLATYPDERVFQALVGVLKNRGDNGKDAARIRSASAVALGMRMDVSAAPVLIDAWDQDKGFLVANSAIKAMGRLNAPGAYDRLYSILNETRFTPYGVRSRSSVVTAIGALGSKQAMALLIDELHREGSDPRDDWSARSSAQALAYYNDPRAIEALRAGLKKDEDPVVREACIYALANAGAKEALVDLQSIVKNNRDFIMRTAARNAVRDLLRSHHDNARGFYIRPPDLIYYNE